MLKDKSILEEFDLVEELEDKIAETINGGIFIKNSLVNDKTILVIQPASASCTPKTITAGNQIEVSGDNLFFVWDRDSVIDTWDLAIKGGFNSTDYLELTADASGKVALDYDLSSGGGPLIIKSVLASSP